MKKNVIPFEDKRTSLASVGGKGLSLSVMTQFGLPVPRGFCVSSTVYEMFLEENNLRPQITEKMMGNDEKSVSRRITQLYRRALFPSVVIDEINQEYLKLGDNISVAVRSSANVEDGFHRSFAGQHETFLNVTGTELLVRAIRDCWCSLWTPQAITYREMQGIDHERITMAVVVQAMVFSDVSGVLFTANPLSGDHSEIVVNASFGLGEGIVSGLVSPDTYVFNRSSRAVAESIINTKVRMIVPGQNGQVVNEEVPTSKKDLPSLSQEQLFELFSLAEKVDQVFGLIPQDIEWCMKGEALYLLQSRPITGLPLQPLENPSWESPIPQAKLMRRQIVEYMPDPLSTLFEDLYLNTALQQAIANNLERLKAPYTLSQIQKGNGYVTVNGYAYQRQDYSFEGLELIGEEQFHKRSRDEMSTPEFWLHQYLPDYQNVIAKWSAIDMATMVSSQLLDGIKALALADANYWFDSVLLLAGTKFPDERLQKFLETAAPTLGVTSSVLLSGLESQSKFAELDVWKIVQRIQQDAPLYEIVVDTKVSRLLQAIKDHRGSHILVSDIQNYQRKYGHQIYTLDFATPIQGEDSRSLLASIKVLVQDRKYNPEARDVRLRVKSNDALEKLREHLDENQMSEFNRLYSEARNLYPYREGILFWLGASWQVLRPFGLEIGRRLVDCGTLSSADDIFFLTTCDIENSIRSCDRGIALRELGQTAIENKKLQEARKPLHPPSAIPIELGARGEITQVQNDSSSNLMRGFPVSGGVVEGQVSVILTPDDFVNMTSNTILVCPFTTPAWTVLFPLAIGLVSDIGGVLAHGSIVAREFGIPAVFGFGDATQRLQSGQRILLDGNKGTMVIYDDDNFS